jgi:hypothetical protein
VGHLPAKCLPTARSTAGVLVVGQGNGDRLLDAIISIDGDVNEHVLGAAYPVGRTPKEACQGKIGEERSSRWQNPVGIETTPRKRR